MSQHTSFYKRLPLGKSFKSERKICEAIASFSPLRPVKEWDLALKFLIGCGGE